jgi:hypothetical protein
MTETKKQQAEHRQAEYDALTTEGKVARRATHLRHPRLTKDVF